jgi:hypothetical protein
MEPTVDRRRAAAVARARHQPGPTRGRRGMPAYSFHPPHMPTEGSVDRSSPMATTGSIDAARTGRTCDQVLTFGPSPDAEPRVLDLGSAGEERRLHPRPGERACGKSVAALVEDCDHPTVDLDLPLVGVSPRRDGGSRAGRPRPSTGTGDLLPRRERRERKRRELGRLLGPEVGSSGASCISANSAWTAAGAIPYSPGSGVATGTPGSVPGPFRERSPDLPYRCYTTTYRCYHSCRGARSARL